MKRLAIGLTAALAVAAVAYIPTWSGSDIGQMEIRELTGDVLITRGGDVLTVEEASAIKPGDQIRMVDGQGEALLRLAGDRRATIRTDAEVTIQGETGLALTTGSLLARTDNGDRLQVSFDEVSARSTGDRSIFRVDQGFGYARAGVYQGTLELSRPGERPLGVDSLFEASVTGGELPGGPRPFRFDSQDRWDQELLEPVISLDEDLKTAANSIGSQLDKTRPGLGYFKQLAGHRVTFMRDEVKQRETRELLIGFSVADTTPGLRLSRAFDRTFALRDDGGPWGVVATIMGSRPGPLLASLDSIVLASGVTAGDEGQSQLDFSLASDASPNPDGGSGGKDKPPSGGDDPGDDPGNDPGDDPGDDPGGGGGDPPTDCQDPECLGDQLPEPCLPPLCEDEDDGGLNGSDEDGGSIIDGLLGGGRVATNGNWEGPPGYLLGHASEGAGRRG